MSSCNGEADLVIELARCRYVAFLLYMESHAVRPGFNAATISSEGAGDNLLFGLIMCDSCKTTAAAGFGSSS